MNTEFESFIEERAVRVLDVGCGNGHLLEYLMKNINCLNPKIDFEFHGFDVSDHGVQSVGYFSKTIESLSKSFPDIPWNKRLKVLSTKDTWPYPDNYFDLVISNQVVEHIGNHELFFSEIHRTLSKEGHSIHLFPLKHYIYEGHLNLPFVHKILNYDFLVSYIKFLSLLGLGKFKSHNRSSDISLSEYSERHADYMSFFTNYLSYSEVLSLGKKHSLRTSFRYTQEFYFTKLRSIFGLKTKYKYSRARSSIADWLAIHVFKYASSITLVLQKKETYTDK